MPRAGPSAKRGSWPSDPRRFRWIVDGHNVIFSHPGLEALQTHEQRAEARRRLEGMLERLAVRKGIEILIVYDGNRMERNPDARGEGRIRTEYSLPPEEADDRILFHALDAIRKGGRVAVVSSDRSTLGSRLPGGALQIEPSEMFRQVEQDEIDRVVEAAEESRVKGRPPGDFSDIEKHFLEAEKAAEAAELERARARERERERERAQARGRDQGRAGTASRTQAKAGRETVPQKPSPSPAAPAAGREPPAASVPDSAAGPARVPRDSSAARPPEPAAARPGVRPAEQKPAGTRAKKEKGLRKQQRRLAWNQRRKGKG